MKKTFLIFSVLITLIIITPGVKADENRNEIYTRPLYGQNEIETAYQFANKIKTVVTNNDLAEFADIIEYPIIIHNYKGKNLKIKNKKMFLKVDKNIIFGNSMKEAVSKKDIFYNYRGFMLGDGEIWFYPFKDGTFKIISLNITE